MRCCSTFNKYAWIYHPLIKIFGRPKAYSQKIKVLANLQKTDVILDVGGGTGVIARLILKHVQKVIVLDPSENMMGKIESKKIEKVIGTAQKIEFADRAFDAVYCVDSFHHFTNGYPSNEYEKTIEQCINELLRVLKKGGKLIIIEFDPEKVKGKCIVFFENKVMRWGSKFYNQNEFLKQFDKKHVNVKISDLDDLCYIAEITKK